jgi:hypothetical protein
LWRIRRDPYHIYPKARDSAAVRKWGGEQLHILCVVGGNKSSYVIKFNENLETMCPLPLSFYIVDSSKITDVIEKYYENTEYGQEPDYSMMVHEIESTIFGVQKK